MANVPQTILSFESGRCAANGGEGWVAPPPRHPYSSFASSTWMRVIQPAHDDHPIRRHGY